MNLEILAMRWLWLEKNCHYITRERTPRSGHGQPDVLGMTKARYLIEVEIKRSMSDFRADSKKWSRLSRESSVANTKLFPKFFFYCAEIKLAEKMVPEIPQWAGLLAFDGFRPCVLLNAPENECSKKVSFKECVKGARAMVNHIMSLETVWDAADRESTLVDGDFQI